MNSFQTTGALLCSHRRAQIGGIPLAELNALELDFLFAIDFDLGVHPADYAACTADLRAFAAAKSVPSDAHLPAAPTTAPLQSASLMKPAAEATLPCDAADSPDSPQAGVATEQEADTDSDVKSAEAGRAS